MEALGVNLSLPHSHSFASDSRTRRGGIVEVACPTDRGEKVFVSAYSNARVCVRSVNALEGRVGVAVEASQRRRCLWRC